MNTVKFGNLTIGEIPRVVGTLLSFDSLRKFATSPDKLCDIAEARLDEIGLDHSWAAECQRIEKSGTPVIATLRAAVEGGKSHLANPDRLKVLREALEHVSAVDVELNSGLAAPLAESAAAKHRALIVSFHDFAQTPAHGELEKIVKEGAKVGSVVKVSTMVKTPSDIQVLERLLRQSGPVPLCVIGMGDAGSSTRKDFPLLGSCLTYGYLDTPAAPGQLSARALVEHLGSARPKPR